MRAFEWWLNRLNLTTAREDGKEKVNTLERIEVLDKMALSLYQRIEGCSRASFEYIVADNCLCRIDKNRLGLCEIHTWQTKSRLRLRLI